LKFNKFTMSNVENVNGQDDVQDKKQKKHDSGAADLERVTDWTEEKEIASDFSQVHFDFFFLSFPSN
jgi:hypothetical protein